MEANGDSIHEPIGEAEARSLQEKAKTRDRIITIFCNICMESIAKEYIMNYQIRMQIRAYKHMLYIFAVNRELHKKTTPELALHIIKFLTHITNSP